MMRDPSQAVPPQLLLHIHLVSTSQFPMDLKTMSPDRAFQYLIEAPRIMKDRSPVTWQYLNCPQDGTVLLAWQPVQTVGTRFATDGYIWADQEHTYTNEVRGYQMEILVHNAGFAPGREQVATHRRARYRLVGAPPGHSPAEQQYEIVHYLQAFHEHHMPANRIPIVPQLSRFLEERKYLEAQGGLSRKEFMLHDSNNWPLIRPPTMPHPMPAGYQQQGVQYNRGAPFQGMGRPQGPPPHMFAPPPHGMGPSPAKRRGPSQSARMPPGLASAIMGTDEFEEERLLEAKDLLDMLTPREISEARYKQHHEWMEEILSSPYATGQIIPNPLGLGLTGELAGLTNGILDVAPDKAGKDAAQPPYQKLAKADVDEIEKRVAEYVRQGEESMVYMKEAHAAKVEELQHQKLFAQLERRLAELSADGVSGETLDQIVHDAERSTRAKITAREEVVRVQKGGIQTAEEQMALQRMAIQTENNNGSTDNDINIHNDESNLLQGGGEHADGEMEDAPNDEFADFTNLDTAGEALELYDEEYGFPS